MKGKTIAISAISSALSIVFITIGNYVSVLDLSCLLLASLSIMLPLYRKTYKGAIFCYFSTLILSIFTTGFKFNIIIPYGVFFGFHPILNEFQLDKKLNRWIFLLIKTIWFIGTLFLMFFTTNFFIDLNEKIIKYIYYVIPIFGIIFFLFYDSCLFIIRKRINILLKSIGL